jgi:hypothetical protein
MKTDPFGPGHLTRFSDSSLYDEKCVKCGATDGRHDERLGKPCPMPVYEHRAVTLTEDGVCPDLVDVKVFGPHTSWVWGTERCWTFENEDGRKAFLEEVEDGAFRRTPK